VYALPNLTTLQADNNNLVTLDAQLGAKVRQFSVPHNSITRFTLAPQLNVAAVTYALTRLDLSHGKISTLADAAFSGLVNLVELNLSFNQFTRLPPTIGELVNLQVMLCTDNMLESLPPMGTLQKLRVLNIHNNNLTGFPPTMWACGRLQHLNASSNLINSVPPPPPIEEIVALLGQERTEELGLLTAGDHPVLPISRSLQYLHLADNRFGDEIFHYISDSKELRTLNLSFNDIFEIPAGTLSRFDKVEELYLSGNKLTTLPAEDLEKLQNLKVLHLNGNKLQTLPSELGALGSLQHLDVGSNVLKYNIANWPYDWNW
jgi:adenylate cyclase